MAKNSTSEQIKVELPVAVDLMKLASSIEARGGSRKLAGTFRMAWRAQSCVADLRQAQAACDALKKLPLLSSALDSATLLSTQSALFASAVTLYARATATSGSPRERGSIQLETAKLTDEQQKDHKTLVTLRNSALGHVESGATIAGDFWHRDFLFAKAVGPGNWQVACASTSIGFHLEAAEILERQLPVATQMVLARCRERIEDAMEALRQLEPSSASLLRYQVDPIAWFGSVETARVALEGEPGEELSSWGPLR